MDDKDKDLLDICNAVITLDELVSGQMNCFIVPRSTIYKARKRAEELEKKLKCTNTEHK